MHRDELEEEVTCSDCGALFWTSDVPAYRWGEDSVLCFGCAIRRGGTYDQEREAWVPAPEVGDLPDERRPHP